MKIIFLDIDGVLNSDMFWRNCKDINEEIDDEAIKRLQQIVNTTNAVIVLSSSWKKLSQDNQLRTYLHDKLKEYGLTIYDQTPHLNSNRPLEIKAWIINHPELNIDGIVSLDDDYSEEEYVKVGLANKTIHTSFYDHKCGGLQDIHIAQAIDILNTPYSV